MTRRVSGLFPTTCKLTTITTFSDRLRNILDMEKDSNPIPEFKITDENDKLLKCIEARENTSIFISYLIPYKLL